ncbi:DUF4124 domain-containing protein [Pseudomonas sp. MMS21-TM103]|uniref:DUF4124 domain-containing protein n=1 Tax=Pseudomonas sp. MMS21 TM103 TaxID=2886506 RepID=UPI001EE02552|nr:DUF4124 domain-containing protein [Pseudomonas sp. MMS21 TM103]MCG4452393.1 DUF4124 domain-containing protein [Pseudomonas sp. MMS21 TM103]
MRNLLLCLLLLSLPAAAQVYTYLDAEGNRVFTDKPRQGNAERIQLAPTNGMHSDTHESPPAVAPPSAPALSYQMLRILVPQPDATIRDNTGNLIVTATSEPSLHPGHGYRLLVDGQATGETGRSPVFALENIDRGTHQLAVEIVDALGRTVDRTPNQPLHMLRISLTQKRLVRPCKKIDYGVRPECPPRDKPAEKKDIPFVPFF